VDALGDPASGLKMRLGRLVACLWAGIISLPASAQNPTLEQAWYDFYRSQDPQFQMKCGPDLYRFSRSVLEGITAFWFDPNTNNWVKLDQLIPSQYIVSFQGIGRPLEKLEQFDIGWFAAAAYQQGAPANAPLDINMQMHIPQRYYIDMQAAYTYSQILPMTLVRFTAGGRPVSVTLPEAMSAATPC
jgi:hypothetical protein